ncbi:MAG: hypothetical protein QF579_06420, partial [Dehalococcoidia bacterium]|nr:hypothetical protein [Dehalococcoidia bacterium]
MKKRFGLFSLIGATVVLMALVGAITTLAAPSAAVTGTIKVDNAWYNITAAGKYPSDVAAGSLVKVTVTDADANVKTAASQVFDMDGITAALAITSTTITLTSGAEIVGTPNVLSTTKTDCSISADVDTDVNVDVFNASTGAI